MVYNFDFCLTNCVFGFIFQKVGFDTEIELGLRNSILTGRLDCDINQDFEIFPAPIGYKLHDVALSCRLHFSASNFQATTTRQTTCSQCSHVATWPDYMTL